MKAVRETYSATALRAWAAFGLAGFCSTGLLVTLSSSGCGDPAAGPAREGEQRDAPARLTDLSTSLPPAPGDQASESASLAARAGQGSTAPRASEDDPACQETCTTKRAECGKVCGEDCGRCPNGEDCQDGKCVCPSSCDGTLCADACGQACACAAGTACDVSGRCVPAGDCSGPLCAPSPELLEPPVLPGAGDPAPQ